MTDEPFLPYYDPPLDQLLRFEEPSLGEEWPDYPAHFGLSAEHIPELIRLATDMELNEGDMETLATAVWGPTHAWRALGQLRAEAAVRPLVNLLHRLEDDDWVHEELPDVFALIGAAAIPILAQYLMDRSHDTRARMTAAEALAKIGQAHPDSREQCVSVLTTELARLDRDRAVNALIISALIDLEAAESAAVIERAFRQKVVDVTVQGGWEDVQVDLGLAEVSPTLRPLSVADLLAGYDRDDDEPLTDDDLEELGLSKYDLTGEPRPPSRSKAAQKKKAKRKQEKKSRKINRKRK